MTDKNKKRTLPDNCFGDIIAKILGWTLAVTLISYVGHRPKKKKGKQ